MKKIEGSSYLTMIIDSYGISIDHWHVIPVVNSAGILLTGLPGTGKTAAGVLTSLNIMNKFGALLEVCDTKRSDVRSLSNFMISHSKERAASSADQVCRLLRLANENLNNRYMNHHNHWGWNWYDYNLRPIVIFFDEVGATLSEAGKKRNEIISNLKQLIYRSRQMGFFVIMSSQRLSANTLDRDLTLELSTRMVLGANSDGDTLRMAFPGVNVDELSVVKNLPGHGLIYTDLLGTNTPQTMVIDDISNLDIPKLIEYLDIKANQMEFTNEPYWKW